MATMRALPRLILPTKPSIPGGIAVRRTLSAGAASLSFQVAHLRRRHFELSATLRSPFAASRSFATIFSSLRSNTAGIGEAVAGRREGWAAVAALLVAAAVVSLFVPPAAKASSPEAEEVAFVKRTVSSHGIVIFSKTYCPFCSNAKAVFKELKKVPHVVELDQREDGQDIQDALNMIVGRGTVPQVFINGKHIGGSDDTVEAYESGMLVKLLGINSDGDL